MSDISLPSEERKNEAKNAFDKIKSEDVRAFLVDYGVPIGIALGLGIGFVLK